MKRSLRTEFFLRAVICMAVVLIANRVLSAFLARDYVIDLVAQNIGVVFEHCQIGRADAYGFGSCHEGATRGSILKIASLDLLLCPGEAHSAALEPAPCAALRRTALRWNDVSEGARAGLESAEGRIDGKVWLLFRPKGAAQRGTVLLQMAEIDEFLERLWGIRDRVYLYVIPVWLCAFLFLTIFMIDKLMRPLKQVRETISQLTSSNLNQPVAIGNRYREFDSVIAAFEELRGRLHGSFLQSQRFAADAAHELRTPLTILRGHAEQAIAELPIGSPTQIRLRVMEEEIGRLSDVTEKLLLLSRADADAVKLDLVNLDFSAFLDELVGDAELFDANLNISAEIEPGIVWHCDLHLVRQLVYNLFTNAVNYNVADGWIHFTARRTEAGLELTVANPTQGFSHELTDKAFDRFYRGDASRTRQVDGQGLGLSLCREIAHLHGGSLTLSVDARDVVRARLSTPLSPVNVVAHAKAGQANLPAH